MAADMLLRDPDTAPNDRTLENSLGTVLFGIYGALKRLAEENFGLDMEWRYYRDGKAWFCKVTNGKKTVFWLSAWDGFLKTSFYFTEKTRGGIAGLPIDDDIKKMFGQAVPSGKLIPLILNIDNKGQLADLEEIIRYKLGC